MIYIIGHFFFLLFFLLQQFPLFSYDLTDSLFFCLVPFQSSSEDQSECTGDERGTGVGW